MSIQARITRWDHKVIFDLVPENATVLDLGCGEGELLQYLIMEKHIRGWGVEKDFAQVTQSISRGISVLQVDVDAGLAGFPDNSFEYVILEKTLQQVMKPLLVLQEMLRVGKVGIVTFPNFAYWRVIASLIKTGRMPVTDTLPAQWYDTPNIHLLTAKDFLDWTNANQVEVVKALALVNNEVLPYEDKHAFAAEEVLFMVSKCSVSSPGHNPTGNTEIC